MLSLNFWRKPRTRFRTFRTDPEHRFSIGLDMSWESYFVAIPVRNPAGDYAEYYRISETHFRRFKDDMSLALPFVEACRRREHDDLLLIPAEPDRGAPT
jgi:hypothetical protein